ncbi:MAG: hypothetical protein HKO93_07900, partial [Flavobacteriales bacterium]|nr:hypothetical protein [Flavobacteriales bacterium]
MKRTTLISSLTLIGIITISVFTAKNFLKESSDQDARMTKTSGAGYAMDQWVFERVYPNEEIPTSSYLKAFADLKAQQKELKVLDGEWESLGPENIGGRTLCLAFHPTDPDVIYAGSASGGLWKTTTRGVGRYAWSPVPTGHPVQAVSSIVIDPDNPDIMYIGTGETYGGGVSQPGVVNRYTRGTYGIGILKTVDGGLTWDNTLVFDQADIKGIQDLEMSPFDSSELYAAATDGLYYSSDAGENWELIFSAGDCIDVELDP